MDNEYDRILKLDSLPNLYECECGYVDTNDCSWYHSNWLLMRYLGMVSNPYWHESFYSQAIKKYVKQNSRVLVMGTADFSMPLLCQNAGIHNIEISDICNTPLNICTNVAEHYSFDWKTRKQNIFDGISSKYEAIINDAFLTRFPYDKKKEVLKKICDGLINDAVYITTLRHAWNNGDPLIPSASEKQDFVDRAVLSAVNKKVDSNRAMVAASQYIENMISYPIKDIEMLTDLSHGLFTIEQLELEGVPGECVFSEYYRVVFRKNSDIIT